MKCAILRVDSAPGFYVARVAHDGDYTLTRDKANARTFTPETALKTRARLARTMHTFSVCPAASVGPVALPYVEKYIRKVEAHHGG